MQHLLRITLIAFMSVPAAGADWLQFRGADTNGLATGAAPPTAWTKDSGFAWRANLPGRGVSSPIVVAGRVIVTASSGARQDRLHVLCFDVATGQLAWERQFWATGRTLCHPTSAVAANTPASDGRRIFAMYSSNDVACLDLDGNLQWYRGLTLESPTAANDTGMAASPVVVGDTLVVQVETQGDSFAAGLNAATGETRWKVPRDKQANWTSPIVMRKTPENKEGQDVVLLQSPKKLTAHNPADGKVVWTYDAACSGVPSATVVGQRVLVPAGGLTAIEIPTGSPNVAPDKLWAENALAPASASPVVVNDRVYTINRTPLLRCGDVKDGKQLWQLRLGGAFWGTPASAGKYLYCPNQQGEVYVVDISDPKEGKIVAQNDLGEPILASPAIVNGALYLRSDGHLWKIGG